MIRQSLFRLIAVVFSILFLSCISNPESTADNSKKDSTIMSSLELSDDGQEVDSILPQVITNDDFILNYIDNQFLLDTSNSDFEIIEIQELANRHYPDQTDSLIIFSNTKDTVLYHVTKYKSILLRAVVISDFFTFGGKLKIGSSIKSFEEVLNTDIHSNQLIVKSFEGFVEIELFFEKDKLVKLTYIDNYKG